MELPGMTTYTIEIFYETERVVNEDEYEKEKWHQDRILDLFPITLRNAQRSVHYP